MNNQLLYIFGFSEMQLSLKAFNEAKGFLISSGHDESKLTMASCIDWQAEINKQIYVHIDIEYIKQYEFYLCSIFYTLCATLTK